METRLETELIPALLEKGVEFHSRRAFRRGCQCNYCATKRWHTRKIAFLRYYDPIVPSECFHFRSGISYKGTIEEWEIHAIVVAKRNRLIAEARKELKDCLQEL